jgi:metallo-beta-lactamase class B
LYASLTRPDVFGNAGVFSCACWIARDSIMALARRTPRGRPSARFYFVVGSQEGRNREPELDQTAIVAALNNAGLRTDSAVVARVAADGRHEEWFWRREFSAAYLWLTGAAAR